MANEESSFHCERCGQCCRMVGVLLPYLEAEYAAIFQPNADGECRHLKQDGHKWKCDIYTLRPQICRTETMAKRRAIFLDITIEASWQMTQQACNMLRKGRRQ